MYVPPGYSLYHLVSASGFACQYENIERAEGICSHHVLLRRLVHSLAGSLYSVITGLALRYIG